MTRPATSARLLAWSLILLCTSSRAAINRGSIQGTITDPQAAIIPGVAVTVSNVDTGVVQTTKTNSAGFYLVAELVPGTYTVRFVIAGFAPTEITSIKVRANDVTAVDVELRLGQAAEQVTV